MLWVVRVPIIVLALGVLSVMLGNGFLPSFSQASKRAPPFRCSVAWALIATAVITCVAACEVLLEQSIAR